MKKPSCIIGMICLLIATMAPAAVAAETFSLPYPLAPKSLLLGAAKAGEDLLIVGERGHVLRSTDHGKSWQQIIVPSRATLTAVSFADHLHGLAVGHDLTILRTEDGGRSWQLIHQDQDEQPPFLDVLFIDKHLALAIGAYGTFFISTDRGLSWEQRWIAEDDLHLNAIARIGDLIFIAAEAGMLYRSDDGGETFEELDPGYEGSFFGLLPTANDSLLLFGLRGNLFRSDDEGESWYQLDTDTDAGLNSGVQLADGTLLIAGLSGTLLRTTDHDDFQITAYQEPDRKGFNKLLETAEGRVLAIGDFGVTLLPPALFR